MVKKFLILALAAIMVCPVISTAAENSASVKVYITDDFEGYTYPDTSDGTIRINESGASNGGTATGAVKNADAKAIESIWEFVTYGFKSKAGLETVERDGAATKAVYLETMGSGNANNNVRFGVKADVAKSVVTDGYRYAVLKAYIKNGSSESDYVSEVRFFRDTNLKISKNTVGNEEINEYDWNEYIFILDTQSSSVSLALNGTLTEITASPTASYFTNLAGLNHSALSIYNVANGAKIWFDNVTLYGTNELNTVIESSVPENGVLNAARSDEIVLKFKGPEAVSALTSENVTVTKTKDETVDAPVSVDSVTYDNAANSVTVKLAEKTDESTYYTVNIPEIKNIFTCISPETSITFRTTGPVELDIAASFKKAADGTALTTLGKGMVEVSAEITNADVVNMQSGVIVAELKKGSETVDLSYHAVENLEVGSSAAADFAFTVPEAEGYSISVRAKDSLNGSYTFSDAVTLSKDGIAAETVANLDITMPTIPETAAGENSVKFYSLTLGENGAREEISELKSGLIECAASVTLEQSENPFVIAALKKDGELVRTAYSTKTGAAGANGYNIAMYVPEGDGYTLDVFVWKDFNGSGSYFKKTTLS